MITYNKYYRFNLIGSKEYVLGTFYHDDGEYYKLLDAHCYIDKDIPDDSKNHSITQGSFYYLRKNSVSGFVEVEKKD